jgi:hypothetical protein
VSGYYTPSGTWVVREVGGCTATAASLEGLVETALRKVQKGQTTARYELRELLVSYPALRQDRENHPLLPLVGLYAKEVLA